VHEMLASGEDKEPALGEIRPTVYACIGSLMKEMQPAYVELIECIDLEGEQLSTAVPSQVRGQ